MKKIILVIALVISSVIGKSQTLPTAGLVAYYPFSGNANDASGNGNNGTVSGATLTVDRFGNSNSAYLFNGTTDVINVLHSASLTFPASTITISFWVSVPSFPNDNKEHAVFMKQSGTGTTTSGFQVNLSDYNSTNSLYWRHMNGNNIWGSSGEIDSSLIYPYNRWYHVVFSTDNVKFKTYLNNVLIDTRPLPANSAIGTNTSNLKIGNANALSSIIGAFQGKLDDIRIYNRAIDSTEVSALFQEGVSAGCGILIDSRDGQQYQTVKIGTQCWMKQNLNYGRQVANVDMQSNNGITEEACYNGSTSNCDKYGGLYTWHEAMNYRTDQQGICPTGWHIPTKNEWETLINYLGSSTAGKQMKSTPTNTIVWDGTNTSGFSGIPAGIGQGTNYLYLGTRDTYWSSTQFNSSDAYDYDLKSGIDALAEAHNVKVSGYSIRCISDGLCYQTITTYDTIHVTVYDTTEISVIDTLVINATLTGVLPPNNVNTLKIYPNPTNNHITIDYGNYSAMNGYTLKITNSLGQTVFTSPITQQQSYIDLSSWTGNGIYFVHIIDALSNTIDIKKIVLQ